MNEFARHIAGLAFALLATGPAADELRIPVGSQPNPEGKALPPKGMPMQGVRAGWGEPELARDPVGQPPITRWDYAGFSVYFEYEHVVHAVLRHRQSDTPPTPEPSPEP
jgi:hypothetical protein